METRKRGWYDHFSNLRDAEFSADSKDDNVKQLFQNVAIDHSLLPMDEFKAVKKNIKTSKEAGPDVIFPPLLFMFLWILCLTEYDKILL